MLWVEVLTSNNYTKAVVIVHLVIQLKKCHKMYNTVHTIFSSVSGCNDVHHIKQHWFIKILNKKFKQVSAMYKPL